MWTHNLYYSYSTIEQNICNVILIYHIYLEQYNINYLNYIINEIISKQIPCLSKKIFFTYSLYIF